MRIIGIGPARKRRQGQGALIATALLILAIGLCLFHGASHNFDGHGMSPDLCASVAMILVAPLLLTIPTVKERLVPVLQEFFSGGSLDLLDRPPESIFPSVVPGSRCRAYSRV